MVNHYCMDYSPDSKRNYCQVVSCNFGTIFRTSSQQIVHRPGNVYGYSSEKISQNISQFQPESRWCFQDKNNFYFTICISNYAATACLFQYPVHRGSLSFLLFSLNFHRKSHPFVSSHLLGVFCLSKKEFGADSTQRCGVTFAKDLLARRGLPPLWGVTCNLGLWFVHVRK